MHSSTTFRAFFRAFLLMIYDSVFAFLSACFNIHFQEDIWKCQPKPNDVHLSSPKNARASRLLSMSRILSLHSWIVFDYSRDIRTFYDVWNMQTFI